MPSRGSGRGFLIAGSVALLLVVLVVHGGDQRPATGPVSVAASTSREGLARTIAAATARLGDDPADTVAAVSLAEALLRQTRVDSDAALAVRAERALRRALAGRPRDYEARRALGAVLLSQHRFRDAIAVATSARDERQDDTWNDGVIGDAHLELGDYDAAFAAFDRMMARRPSAAAYARVSYARELRGDLDGAARLMRMSLEATSAHDPESQAWHEVRLGHLAFDAAASAEARRHFERAEFLFPRYGLAAEGLVRVLAAEGRLEQAMVRARDQFAVGQTSTLAVQIGDLARALGQTAEAERHYQIAERLLRYEPAALAVFLADRDRNIAEAVGLAKTAAATRDDIFTADAVAWTLFKAGRADEALPAARRALRTGTRDRHLLAHAAAIHDAVGQTAAARRLARRALAGHDRFDLVGAEEARRVLSGGLRTQLVGAGVPD